MVYCPMINDCIVTQMFWYIFCFVVAVFTPISPEYQTKSYSEMATLIVVVLSSIFLKTWQKFL